MLINNGSTVTAAVLANRLKMKGESITRSSTIRIGQTKDFEEVYAPLKNVVPMVDSLDSAIGGWDCNSTILADAMRRAQVLEPEFQWELRPRMENITLPPATVDLDFIATNRTDRVGNVPSMNKFEAVEKVCQDFRDFKAAHDWDKVIVLWTSNTVRFTEVQEETHDTSDNILAALVFREVELAPSGAATPSLRYLRGALTSTALRRTTSLLASPISPRGTT